MSTTPVISGGPAQDERERFLALHPRSVELAHASEAHFLWGVPLHWMRDWPSPSTLFVASAQAAQLQCADGLTYSDFCLGDTGAMFGHSPAPLSQAIAHQAAQGLTCMLPSVPAPLVGALLQERFGLPQWQLALSASDANRFVLRWCRAVTQRAQVLVFDGCYHGAVDDTLVDLHQGRTVARASVLGQIHDHARFTRVVPFNDLSALREALADGQVACLLAEPALTNCGLVLPDPDFWPQAMALCHAAGTLVVLDETHTLSTALGGFAHSRGLQPDMLVVGKAVAGGLPCAVYGMSREMAQSMTQAKALAAPGHSGIGTTLSANPLMLAALHASLLHLHTPANYDAMLSLAQSLQARLQSLIAQRQKPWTVTRLGARLELQFMAPAPRNAQDVRQADSGELEAALHLFMLNRGVLLTPFHCMMLVSPVTTEGDVQKLLDAFAQWMAT
jgi:glutamate-1-semialdehyde 2,1-aminomutase